MARQITPAAPLVQGVPSPRVTVNPDIYYLATRRMRYPMRSRVASSGPGVTDSVTLRKTGVVSALEVRVTGTLVFGGTITGTSMTYEWPLNIIQEFRLSANGQANLMRCRGITLRALEFTMNPRLDDSGLSGTFGSTAVTSGTLKLPCDDWGSSSPNFLNPGATVAATGTYTVDITYWIPVAADAVTLLGSIFAQSEATNLTAEILWATNAQLATLGGSATLVQNLSWQVQGVVYSIPQVNGEFVVPDLSQFHQVAEVQYTGLSSGTNQALLTGTGAGRKLLRVLFQTVSSAAPLAVTDANYTLLDWAYGGNDVPETYSNGGQLRAKNVREFGVDLGANWGIGVWDFASQFALRDVVDEGATSDLRLELGLANTPTNGVAKVAAETLFAAPVGA
jgi:hypothetical protein